MKKIFNKLNSRGVFSIYLLFLSSGCSLQIPETFFTGIGLSPFMLALFQGIVLFMMVLGLVSLLFLIIPGLTIIWICTLVYGLLTGFTTLSGILFGLITVLMIVGNMTDQLVMGAKAKNSGASWLSIFLSTGAAFIFSLLFPPFGGLIAALIVLLTAEIIRLKDWRKAAQSSKEMAFGFFKAIAIRFGIGLFMIGTWVIWVWHSGQSIFGS